MRTMIRAIPDSDCNSLNRFKPNKWYPAVHQGQGWCVSVEGAKRFVGPELGGGAHLQRQNERTGWEYNCRTAGHFELREVPD